MFRKRRRPSALRPGTCDDKNDSKSEELIETDGGEHMEVAKQAMEVQKLRRRKTGISHISLASGKKLDLIQEQSLGKEFAEDPFKVLRTDLPDVLKKSQSGPNSGQIKAVGGNVESKSNSQSDQSIGGTQFSRETHLRDEDEEMRKFIEAELKRRNNRTSAEDGVQLNTYKTPEDKALDSLPAHLRKSNTSKNEDMLSNQMLSGIPEVDLGIEERIRNIAATDKARQRLEAKSREAAKKRIVSSDADELQEYLANDVNFHLAIRRTAVPGRTVTTRTVNDSGEEKAKQLPTKEVVTYRVAVGEAPVAERQVVRVSDGSDVDRKRDEATDEYHIQKFKQASFQRK